MATSDTYTLVISDTGVPSAHAASHTAGGGDEIAVNISQLDDIAANTVLGNLTGATAAVTAVATTGTGNVVRATGPTITLANATGLPLTTGVTGILPAANGGTGVSALGTGVATFLGTPTSANLRGAITDETGTGLLVFANNPEISSPTINGTPVFSTPLSASNGGTGISALGAGVATFLGTPSSANLATAVTGETGTGALVFGTGPILTSPTISGTPTFSSPLSVANGGTGVSTLNANAVPFLQTPTSANLRTLVTDEQGTGGGLVFATSPTLTTATLVSPTITSPTFTAPLPVASGGTGVAGAARGCLSYIAGTATQVLAAQNVYTQLSIGTPMTLSNAQDVVLGAANTATLRYNTTFTGRYFLVSVHVNLDAGTYADLVGLKLYSGAAGSHSAINETEIKWRLYHSGGTTLPADMIVSWILPLSPFEEVSAYIANFSAAARTLYINSVRMTLHAIV